MANNNSNKKFSTGTEKSTMTRVEIASLAKANAAMAIDQRHEFGSIQDALNSYYENLNDSLGESDRKSLAIGELCGMFDSAVAFEATRLGLKL